LARRTGEQRLGQDRISLPDQEVRGEIAVANDRSDPNRAIWQLNDLVQGQVADVDDQVGRGYPQLHVVDQVGAAGQIHGIRVLGHRRDRAGDVLDAEELERHHDADSPQATRRIAATTLT
jgi:hypothetical protein